MFDFSNLDPETIAKFWTYCIGFFIIGLIIGWFVRSGLTRIAVENFRSEKEKFEFERTELMNIKVKYDAQCMELEKNDEYWLYKRQVSEQPGVDPSELLHSSLSKK